MKWTLSSRQGRLCREIRRLEHEGRAYSGQQVLTWHWLVNSPENRVFFFFFLFVVESSFFSLS